MLNFVLHNNVILIQFTLIILYFLALASTYFPAIFDFKIAKALIYPSKATLYFPLLPVKAMICSFLSSIQLFLNGKYQIGQADTSLFQGAALLQEKYFHKPHTKRLEKHRYKPI
jgi:hypothetical protein